MYILAYAASCGDRPVCPVVICPGPDLPGKPICPVVICPRVRVRVMVRVRFGLGLGLGLEANRVGLQECGQIGPGANSMPGKSGRVKTDLIPLVIPLGGTDPACTFS
jgi:hypothetical protein